MRCEDLFEQCRSGARQSDNENRIGRRAPSAFFGIEQCRVAVVGLRLHFPIDPRRVITDFFAFQAVAALIINEGVDISALILKRFAKRKTQVIAIHQLSRTRVLDHPHVGDLVIGKTVGFKVGKAPIGIAEIRTQVVRAAVGSNCIGQAANRFERVTHRQMNARIVRRFGCPVPVDAQRFVEIADRKILVGVKHVQLRVAGLLCPQDGGLFKRFGKLLALVENADIIEMRAGIIGFQHDR